MLVWHKRRLLYTAKCRPLKFRAQAFCAEVVASLLWGADNWIAPPARERIDALLAADAARAAEARGESSSDEGDDDSGA